MTYLKQYRTRLPIFPATGTGVLLFFFGELLIAVLKHEFSTNTAEESAGILLVSLGMMCLCALLFAFTANLVAYLALPAVNTRLLVDISSEIRHALRISRQEALFTFFIALFIIVLYIALNKPWYYAASVLFLALCLYFTIKLLTLLNFTHRRFYQKRRLRLALAAGLLLVFLIVLYLNSYMLKNLYNDIHFLLFLLSCSAAMMIYRLLARPGNRAELKLLYSPVTAVFILLLTGLGIYIFRSEARLHGSLYQRNSALPYFLENVAALSFENEGGVFELGESNDEPGDSYPELEKDLSGYNVILVSVDTLRYDHTTTGGYRRNTTPFLAELAGRSIDFKMAQAPSDSTFGSMYAILSGNFPYHPRVILHTEWFASWLLPENLMAGEIFKKAGYVTMGLNNSNIEPRGWEQGFDRYINWGSLLFGGKIPKFDVFKVVSEAARFIHTNRNQKQFVWIHLGEPHAPYQPYDWSKWFGKSTIDRYDTTIFQTDHILKKLYQSLEKSELDQKTVFIVLSDHGEHFGEKGLWYHSNSFYNENMHVPMVVHIPGEKPRSWRVPVATHNLFHWLFKSLFKNSDIYSDFGKEKKQSGRFKNDIVMYRPDERIGWVKGSYKFIYTYQRHMYEAFHLFDDYAETYNLFHHEYFQQQNADLVKSFKELVKLGEREWKKALEESRFSSGYDEKK